MVGLSQAPPFRGRSRERHELDRLLDDARGGQAAALVLRGDAGIGKTALMHYCARQASGCRVVEITGVESELELPFAALQQLCRPFLDRLPALPEPQANALRVAFGLSAGAAPDRFIVGMGFLGLLAEVAEERPLVCLVDDAQWLDEPTRQMVGFAARRLQAEAIVMLLAVREAGENRLFPRLPALTLDGLRDEDARALLHTAVPGPVDEQMRDRIVAESGGNPLALLELPKGMSSSELAGGFAAQPTGSLSGQLHNGYLRRVQDLPEPTQRLMLLAAVDPTGDATLLWRAARSIDIDREAAVPADQEDLLRISDRVLFRHPLVRSAVYAAGSAENRRAAHLALADATDAESDPERRIWHLAAAATGPDEALATQLEGMSATARARAGLSAAAAFLERSLELTADPSRIADRAMAAATANLHAGALDTARALAAVAGGASLDDLQRVRVEQLRGQIEAAARPASDAPARLLETARRLEPLDIGVARDTYHRAWWAAVWPGKFAAPGCTIIEISQAALATAQPPVRGPSDDLLEGLATVMVDGRAAAAPRLRSAVNLFITGQVSYDDWIQWARSATAAAAHLWDFPSWFELSARQVALARETGALAPLVLALNLHANVTTLSGDLNAAAQLAAEQYAVKEVTGIRLVSSGALLLAGYRGQPQALATVADEDVEPDEGYAIEMLQVATAVLNNGLRRYGDAVSPSADVGLSSTSLISQLALPELVEAAVRANQKDLARQGLHRLSEIAIEGSDWAAGIQARCQALVGNREHAEHFYRRAIDCLDRTPLRIDRARARLLYGEFLRRESRRTEARKNLRFAYEQFTAIGTQAFAERARVELAATGEKARPRVGSDRQLTQQEENIARLAAEGRNNTEIGVALFISRRTVEWHLGKVFLKLGITSRMELRDALPPSMVPPSV